ncbi:cold shock protein CspA-like [Portunus trituberculatus]|uniref:cold shock protein CspA-like n=1 Tax=Portunus trituberculatus TaxID=210409 RepID=UPI001E1CE193|nr:cold shock protein CspA-like [Portunus trituberculatus]
MAGQQHQGEVKWYNYKRGYGFIRDHSTKTDVFVHFSGLKRSLQKRLPREGDKVHFTVHMGDKGPEARETERTSSASHQKPPLRTVGLDFIGVRRSEPYLGIVA